jgi:hypothetical protein
MDDLQVQHNLHLFVETSNSTADNIFNIINSVCEKVDANMLVMTAVNKVTRYELRQTEHLKLATHSGGTSTPCGTKLKHMHMLFRGCTTGCYRCLSTLRRWILPMRLYSSMCSSIAIASVVMIPQVRLCHSRACVCETVGTMDDRRLRFTNITPAGHCAVQPGGCTCVTASCASTRARPG